MKEYVKFDKIGEIEFAPNTMRKGSRLIMGYNQESNEERLFADGYKILINTPIPQDGKVYDRKLEEKEKTIEVCWVEHMTTDLELEFQRNHLFNEISDPLFVRVQRGALDPAEYIKVVAEIKFDNRYSNERQKSFDEFFNEAVEQWNKSNPDKPVAMKKTYQAMENVS